MKNDMKISKAIIVFIFTGLFFVNPDKGNSQDLLLGPVTGNMDFKSIFANPATLPFHNAHLAIGMKGYHMGFFEESGLAYSQGFASLASPRLFHRNVGGGMHIQYFDSPMFRRMHLGTTASYRLFNVVAIGLEASMINLSYNRDNFDLVDPGDPVFSDGYGKTVFNTSAGLYYQPLINLSFGAGIRNINEPNLAMTGPPVKSPREIFAGVSASYGILKGTFELIDAGYGLRGMTYVEVFSGGGYYLRSGATTAFDRGHIEAQAHLFGSLSANYQFELPFSQVATGSSGSHMVSLIFEFNRIPSLPQRVDPPTLIIPFNRARTNANLSPNILLSSRTDHVKFNEKQIIRRVDPSVTASALASLSVYDIGSLRLDPNLTMSPYMYTTSAGPIPSSVDFSSPISLQYRDALNFVRDLANRTSTDQMNILTGTGSQLRAAGLRNRFARETGSTLNVGRVAFENPRDSIMYATRVTPDMLRDEQTLELDPEYAEIRTFITEPIPVRSWVFRVEDVSGNLVRTISGATTVPEIITWDWTDNRGNIIQPGVYNYYIRWTDSTGREVNSNKRTLYVQKILRRVTIDISRSRENMLQNPDRLNIILKN